MKRTFKQKTKVARSVTSVSCCKKKTKLARPVASISSHTGASSSIVIHRKSKWREELLAAASQHKEDAASESETEAVLRDKKQRLLLETKAILGNNKERVRDISYDASETEASGIKKERLPDVKSCCWGLQDLFNSHDCGDIIANTKAEIIAEMKADVNPEVRVEMKAEIKAEMARRQAEMARGEADMATWEARMETIHTRLGEKLEVLVNAWLNQNWEYRMEEKLKARWIEDKMKAMVVS